MTGRQRSLRGQLLAFGLVATILPILVLLVTVFATSTSSEVVLEGAEGPLVDEGETSGDVPVAVPIVGIAVAVAAAVGIWSWSGRAVRPMNDITALADEIQAGSLDRRLGLDGAVREVQDLGDSFDRMLDRLERSGQTQRQLIEDASHELRTPLAALAVNTEVMRNHPDPTDADYEQSLARSEELVRRLQLTIDELLRGARSRNEATRQIDNDLVAIVQRVVEQHRTLRPEIPVSVTAPAERRAAIDGPSVERAVANLVENAARFSPPGTPIEIEVNAAGVPTVSVSDSGPGIAPEDCAFVFDRYYRADEGGGQGIGLALVKQVADAHGSITLESPPAGRTQGTRFVMHFADPTPGPA